jgi:hypothetical protein
MAQVYQRRLRPARTGGNLDVIARKKTERRKRTGRYSFPTCRLAELSDDIPFSGGPEREKEF